MKTRPWSTRPLLRILISFTVGIVLYDRADALLISAMAGIALLVLIIKPFFNPFLQFRFLSLYGLCFHVLIISVGILGMYQHDIRNSPNWFANKENPGPMIVKVSGTVKKKSMYCHALVAVLYTRNGNTWVTSRGNLSMYFPGSLPQPVHGESYLVNADIQPIRSKNAAFDYKALMALKNIYHQSYPPVTAVCRLSTASNTFSLTQLTNQIRNYILSILDRYIGSPAENGLAKALLIGYRDDLDKNLVTAYTNTGVIHIIAISGMHLGLIYVLLARIWKFSMNKKFLHSYRSLFIAAVLWIFSILCGASPSVLRSALMFTCLLAGEAMQKENYTVNALAASAFILLCLDPKLLWDIGFQLSYAAVGSLLAYNRFVTCLYRPENNIIVYAWNAVATSISAQVLTTPLVLYHFHQFPLLFILANLVAVPLSGIILILLIMLCLFSPIPFIAGPLGQLCSWLSTLMNQLISRLDNISFGVVDNIETRFSDAILMYCCILFFSLWVTTKKPAALLSLLSTILVWLVIIIIR